MINYHLCESTSKKAIIIIHCCDSYSSTCFYCGDDGDGVMSVKRLGDELPSTNHHVYIVIYF